MPKSIYSEQYREMLAMLRGIRLERGVTQTDLMKQLKLDQSTISRIENGDRRLDVIELRSYCLAMGTTLSDFARELEKRLSKTKVT